MALEGILAAFEALPAFRRLVAELPGPGGRSAVAGLAGSTDAVLVAALARRLPRRLLVVVTDAVSDAERWLADLQVLIGDAGVALYPPREGFGEVEPHTEIAGERVETLERLMRSDVHILLTTSRAMMERSARAEGTRRRAARAAQGRRAAARGPGGAPRAHRLRARADGR